MTKLPSQYKYQNPIKLLALGSALLLFAYVSLVGKTVANALERQESEKAIAEISALVSKSEFVYLNEKSSINASMARDMGFVEVSNTSVTNQKSLGSLSLNEI